MQEGVNAGGGECRLGWMQVGLNAGRGECRTG